MQNNVSVYNQIKESVIFNKLLDLIWFMIATIIVFAGLGIAVRMFLFFVNL
jgi:hypothetical protein